MLICLSIDHAGKPHSPRDRGAVYPPGATLTDAVRVEEVDLTRRYVAAADRELRALGHDCIVLSDGTYAARWARADSYGAAVYVACHVDAGGGDRGTVYHDHRSGRGLVLAGRVALTLAEVVPWPVAARAARPDSDARPGNEGERAFSTIEGVRAVGLCYEPGFLDNRNESHRQQLFGRAEDCGLAIARGIAAWAKG